MNKVLTRKRNNFYTKNYFFFLTLTVLMLGLIAFSDNFYFDIGQESNRDPGFIIHGLLMYAWFIIIVVQTNHIKKLNYKAHIKLGIFGFILAILISITIGYLFAVGQSYNELPFFGKANRFFYAAFIVLVLVGYLKRDKPELHKHAIIVGILLMMEPLLSRVGMNTGTDAAVVAPVIWLILWMSLFVYDIVRLKRLHFLTYSGLIFWFIVYAIVS
ncbi:MAG: hypothetical protein ACNS62_03350 [Candidatus Cyclobacteriaceae bacterium M3_2C_046]